MDRRRCMPAYRSHPWGGRNDGGEGAGREGGQEFFLGGRVVFSGRIAPLRLGWGGGGSRAKRHSGLGVLIDVQRQHPPVFGRADRAIRVRPEAQPVLDRCERRSTARPRRFAYVVQGSWTPALSKLAGPLERRVSQEECHSGL